MNNATNDTTPLPAPTAQDLETARFLLASKRRRAAKPAPVADRWHGWECYCAECSQ